MTEDKNETAAAKSLRHDLLTPINQIIGYGEMLEEEAAADGHENYLGDLKKIGIAARDLLAKIDSLPLDGHEGNGAPAKNPPGSGPGVSAPGVSVSGVQSGEYVAPAGSREEEEPEKPARILVVDDVELNRSMLSRRLGKRGYDVEVAEGGAEALEMIREKAFDIVLLDIMMPEVSGYDVLEEVRKEKSPLELPIIMATAKDEGEDVVSAFKLGANDYITKPIDFPVALARIETQLSRKRAMEQSKRLTVELERHNQFIRKTFGRYLSKDIVENLLSSPEGLALGGEKRTITILMSDLRGFSALSEKLDPEQVVAMLNGYLGKMADVVTHHNGTIDEFIGDAVLVLFGAPTAREDDVQQAAACALEMQLAMKEVNEENKKNGFPELEMGIALNTGECVVGNIGSQKRAKYGVVGSHVNLTGRIESYTVGGQILVSAATAKLLEGELVLGDELKLGAKGFKAPVVVYDLLGMKGRFNLSLPKRTEEMRALVRDIPTHLAILDGKHVKEDDVPGAFLSLSLCDALISSDRELHKLANLRLRCTGLNGVIIPSDLYAKVTDASNGRYTIRFTSVPDEIKSYFRSILANEVA
ncbi:MAG: response regulator [Acidobacteria bacterium]|nr:MAG: response regulator [Acidobacteriota bacterium]